VLITDGNSFEGVKTKMGTSLEYATSIMRSELALLSGHGLVYTRERSVERIPMILADRDSQECLRSRSRTSHRRKTVLHGQIMACLLFFLLLLLIDLNLICGVGTDTLLGLLHLNRMLVTEITVGLVLGHASMDKAVGMADSRQIRIIGNRIWDNRRQSKDLVQRAIEELLVSIIMVVAEDTVSASLGT